MKPSVLFIKGIRDDKSVNMLSIENDNLVFNVGGSSNLYRFIDNDRFDKVLLTLDSKPNSSINTMGCHVLVNQISDFDSYKITLNKISSLLEQLNGNMSCINRPEHIKLTTRDSISSHLQNINTLIVPKTIRLAPESPEMIVEAITTAQMELPVLIRECGRHGGERTALLKSHDDIQRLYAFALDGRDYYLTAFHDYCERDKKGRSIYKKCRLVVVDGKPYIRHLIISDNWMIHSKNRTFMDLHPEYMEEESQWLSNFHNEVAPLIQPAVTAIHDRIKLDYFGIDCNIRPDGTILVFEINATMNILFNNAVTPNKWESPIEKIKQAIVDMIMARVSTP